MLRIVDEWLPRAAGMLRLGVESQHLTLEPGRRPADSQLLCLARNPPGLRKLRIGLRGIPSVQLRAGIYPEKSIIKLRQELDIVPLRE